MSSKHPEIANPFKVHAAGSLALIGFRWALPSGERAAVQDAEKAKQPPKPRGLDFLGAGPPTKPR